MFCLLQPFFKKVLRCVSRIKLKFVIAVVGILVVLDVFGAFTHIFEVTYNDSNFIYPYHGNIHPYVEALRRNKIPDMEPINMYNYTFVHNPKDKCVDPDFRTVQIVFFVKSSVDHFERREGIRRSWGFGKRFFDAPTRLIFLLGVHPQDVELARGVSAEADKHKDLLQADFIDSYFNNTVKTMMGFRWAVEHCMNAKFYMFVDDDMYVSVKNVLRFVRNPAYYPDYLKEPSRMAARKREIKASDMLTDSSDINDENASLPIRKISKRFSAKEKIMVRRQPGWSSHNKTRMSVEAHVTRNGSTEFIKNNRSMRLEASSSIDEITVPRRQKRQVFDLELPEDVRLFAGYVFVSAPHRHRTSKWYISLKEYPYHLWPPYVTAGAYILSKEALIDMYYTSLYTQHFRFDDIYLGIVAKKADIEPFHCDEFHFYKKDYTKYNYKYVITSHGYEDPNELATVWQEQKSLGNA